MSSTTEDRHESAPAPVFPSGVGPPGTGREPMARPSIPRPIVFVALAYIAGLVLGRFLLAPAWSLVAATVACAGTVAWNLLRRRTHPFRAPSEGLPLWIAIALLGWLASNHVVRVDGGAAALESSMAASPLARVEGRVIRAESWGPAGVRLYLHRPFVETTGSHPVARRLALAAVIEFAGPDWEVAPSPADLRRQREALVRLPGARIRTWARPRPLATASHPWAFDPAAYFRHQGVAARFELPDLSLIEGLTPPSRPRQLVSKAIAASRDRIRHALAARLTPDSAGLASAIALGDRSGVSTDTRDQFRDSGLMHLLVVSGMHTAFMLGIALMLTRWLGLPPVAWAPVGLLTLLLYTALVGFYPPVVRASIMGAFLLGAGALGRPTSTLSALGASALLTLLFDPRNLMRADWQLSYACVLSLTVLTPPLGSLARSLLHLDDDNGASTGWPGRLRYTVYRFIAQPAIAIIAILMGLMPLQVHYFGQLNLGAIASNLIAIPLVNGIMLGAYLMTSVEKVPGAAPLISRVMEEAVHLLMGVTARFAARGPLHLDVAALHPALVAGFALFLLVGPHLRRGEGLLGRPSRAQHRHAMLRIVAFFILLAWAPLALAMQPRPALELFLLDVGQGDAIVIRTPDNRVGVIDAGGGLAGGHGARTVVPFLRGLGVGRLDFVAASHADADHVGGLDAVIEAFDPPVLLVGPHTAATDAWAEVVRSAGRRGTRLVEVSAGQSLRGLGRTTVEFLGPVPGQSGNDASIVMLLRHGRVEILLTGDIERGTEERIVREGAAVDIDVLKVAHHGSRTSTTENFLDAFDPEWALISAGRGNRFGHPAPDVLARLEARGIRIARTDLHGTIRLRTDGERVALDRYGLRID